MSDEPIIRTLNSRVTLLSKPFTRLSLFHIGGRASLIQMQSKKLAVFSPVALTPNVRQKVEQLGNRVEYLIAPDFEHHMYIGEWKKHFPSAKVIGVEGLQERRKDVHFDHIFTAGKAPESLPDEFREEFEYQYFPGFINKDLALMHKPSRTLFEADLMFNLPAYEQYSQSTSSCTTGFTRLFNLFHWQSTALKRFLWYVVSKDRGAMKRDAKVVASWDFDTIVPCHGEVMEGNGKNAWLEAYKWFLAEN